jgi:transcriptional regulator with GAF, ATPase, and Fis domain
VNSDDRSPAAVDPDVEARVQAVTATGLDAVAEPVFDNIAGLVRTLLDVPVAVVSLLDARRQFFPGASGLAEPWATHRQTPLSHALCQLVALAQEPLVVTDARHDRRCDTNRAITELGIVGYAGMPLTDAAGTVVGALCAIDHQPRIWTEAELSLLADVALACSDSLRLRIASHHAEAGRIAAAQASRLALAASARSQLLLKASVLLSQARTVAQIVAAVAELTSPVFDPAHVGMVLLDAEQRLQVFGADNLPGDVADRWIGFPISAPLPAAEAYRTGQLIALPDPAAIAAGYPQLAAEFAALSWQAVACGPVPGVRGTLGVLTFSWTHPQKLDADQRSVIITLAGYVGQALQRVTYLDEQNTAARTLQQALLTRLPPSANGCRLAARYLPAHHGDLIGGDWYDAVPLTDSRLALIIGDVSGHNLPAAAAMSELRSMLRGLLIVDRAQTPSAVLEHLDHANHALGANSIATVLIAYLDTEPDGSHTLQWSNAGHTPPTVITTDGQITALPGNDPLLGARHRKPRITHQHRLPPGAILLLHTDGLVETRNATIDDGIARLHRLLADHHPHLDPDSLADRLVAHADSGTREDDVALLLAATTPVTADAPTTATPALHRQQPTRRSSTSTGPRRPDAESRNVPAIKDGSL